MKIRYTFTISDDVIQALDVMARGNMRSRSGMIESAIMKEFDRYIAAQQPKLEARQEAINELKEAE